MLYSATISFMDCTSSPSMNYEQQQIQQIIQTQIAQQKEKERLELLSIQKSEYEQALQQDLQKELQPGPEPEPELEFEEPSLEEVRRVRLLRFEKKNRKQTT